MTGTAPTITAPRDQSVAAHECLLCGRSAAENHASWDEALDQVQVTWTGDAAQPPTSVTRYVCTEHRTTVAGVLASLGFATHRHDTHDALEDLTCPGAQQPDDCVALPQTWPPR